MDGKWETLPVAEAPLEIIDGDRGVNYPKQEEFGSSGDCLFLNTGNVTTTGFNFAYRSFITKEKDAALRKGKLRRHDVVLTTRGTVGNVALFDDTVHFCDVRINSGMVLLRADQSKLLPRFLFQFVRSPLFREQVAALTTGSAQPQLPIRDIRRVKIPLPPLAQQKAIAAVLGALDDKIELIRRMNATLEAMARALFQSWFIDFDPVRANLDRNQPSPAASRHPLPVGAGRGEGRFALDPGTAALFPVSFQGSAVGPIPTGWDAISLYDTARWINGAAFKNEDFCTAGTGLPVIKIAELKDGISVQTKWSQRDAVPDKVIETGELLYSWSGSPDTSLEAFLWSGGRGLLNQHIFKVISRTPAEKRFVYYLLQYLRPVLVETARNKQTTGLGHVTIADMKRLLVCIPSEAVLSAFDQIVAPMFDKAFTNTLESRTLASLRDRLLPELLSGRVSAPSTSATHN